jgi:GntR family transcriptional regulator
MNQWIPDITHRHGSLHATLVEAIEDAIRSGVFREGERLPAQRLLADQLSVHANTVNRAFMEIARRGLVVGRTRRGTVVLPSSRKRLDANASKG